MYAQVYFTFDDITIIIFNDNNMSISKNYSGVEKRITDIRASHLYIDLKHDVKNNLKSNKLGTNVLNTLSHFRDKIKDEVIDAPLFKEFNLDYMGPVDGHDIAGLIKVFQAAKEHDGPIVVHVLTQKGKGYKFAEQDKVGKWHGVSPFDVVTGKSLSLLPPNEISWSQVISNTVMDLAEKDKSIVAITPAMAQGSKLLEFQKRYPDRFFDCGIAEQHAVTMACAMALGGLKPFVSIYSSFLQRAYDQMIHDVALQNLPVMFAVDRAGLVGNDGETHQGIFDLSYLNSIPNMVIMSPKHKWELADMVRFGISYEGPIAIRYPRGSACDVCPEFRSPIEYGKSEILYEESDIAIIFVGHMFEEALKVREDLKEKGYDCSLINARFIKPLDAKMLDRLTKKHRLIVTIEENVKSGGFGEHVSEYLMRTGADVRVQILALPDDYVEHGNVDVLRKETGLDVESMTAQICKMYETM